MGRKAKKRKGSHKPASLPTKNDTDHRPSSSAAPERVEAALQEDLLSSIPALQEAAPPQGTPEIPQAIAPPTLPEDAPPHPTPQPTLLKEPPALPQDAPPIAFPLTTDIVAKEEPAASLPEAMPPQEPPLWRTRTAQTFAWLFGFVLLFHWVDREGQFDLISGVMQKTLERKDTTDPEAEDTEEEIFAAPSPGMPFGPKLEGNPSVVDEEPPLPPPVRPGAEPKPFTGQAIEDPCVKTEGETCLRYAMDPFYAALEKVLRKEPGAIARLAHFGDSIIASDYISSRVRERLASTFGDAGHGFIYLGKPSRWYYRHGLVHKASEGWVIRGITGERKAQDDLYGLGGASFEALGPGIQASFSTSKDKELGKNVSRFDVYYLEQPGGGVMELLVDGKLQQKINTHAETTRAAFYQLRVEDGPHTLTVRSASGRVRAFGVVMERDVPGVVYDSLGMVSGSAKALLSIDKEHWKGQLAHREPHLVILMFGTNEANYTSGGEKSMAEYQGNLEQLLATIRAARPDAACLLMSPPDSAERKDGKLVTKAVIPKLVEAQRRAAFNSGCAYWDTFTWMGGKGSMAKWFKQGLGQSDYAHPTRKGAARIGDAFFDALMAGYDAYAARRKTAP